MFRPYCRITQSARLENVKMWGAQGLDSIWVTISCLGDLRHAISNI